jgi:hypothetical protein
METGKASVVYAMVNGDAGIIRQSTENFRH